MDWYEKRLEVLGGSRGVRRRVVGFLVCVGVVLIGMAIYDLPPKFVTAVIAFLVFVFFLPDVGNFVS